MAYPDWPLFDLRLRTHGMVLRPMTEADLSTVADLMPADLELDPAATTYPRLTTDVNRRVILHVMTHLRLRRTDWPGPGDVEIEGFDACRALFGS